MFFEENTGLAFIFKSINTNFSSNEPQLSQTIYQRLIDHLPCVWTKFKAPKCIYVELHPLTETLKISRFIHFYEPWIVLGDRSSLTCAINYPSLLLRQVIVVPASL